MIDRQSHATVQSRLGQLDLPITDPERGVGTDDVDGVGLELDSLVRIVDRHAGTRPEKLRQQALVRRIQVLHQQEGHAGVGRQGLEQLAESLQATSRSPYADD